MQTVVPITANMLEVPFSKETKCIDETCNYLAVTCSFQPVIVSAFSPEIFSESIKFLFPGTTFPLRNYGIAWI